LPNDDSNYDYHDTDDERDGSTPSGHYHVNTATRHEHNDSTTHYHNCTGPHTHEQPHPTDDRGELRERLARGPIESTR